MEAIPAVVIGAGQAGLATSRELTVRGLPHVVLEAGRIGDTWTTRRWRSFRVVSPNWLTRLPGAWYGGPDPDGFMTAAELVAHLHAYASSFGAPVRTGVRVRRLAREAGSFVLDTTAGPIETPTVVVATGAFGEPSIPALAAALPPATLSIHTDAYRSPDELPPGGVLVVGAGQSGLQIADELALAGRDVVVAVGRHGWVPRTLYGRDQMDWRLEMGDFRAITGDPANPSPDYPFTLLARWGREDFHVRTVWQHGVRLAGRLGAIDGGRASFADDLTSSIAAGTAVAKSLVDRIRDHRRGRGEDAAEVELASAWRPGEVPAGLRSLELAADGVGTVIWATGYRHDWSWIDAPGAIAPTGAPYQRAGASPVEGLYFVGIHRGWHGGDGTLLGAGWLPELVADTIARRVEAR